MNRSIRQTYCYFLLLTLLVSGVARGQHIAHTYLESDQIVIGEQVNLVLEVRTSGAGRIRWTRLPDTLKTIEIIASGKIDTVRRKDSILYRQKLLVTSFDPGKATIPPLAFYSINGAQTDTFYSKPLLLNVTTVTVDTTKPFKPIKDIAEVEASSGFRQFIEHLKSYWKLYLGMALLLGLIIFVILYFIRNKKVRAPESKLPPEQPHEKARRLLNELAAAKLWEQGRIKEYYSSLSDIVRNYLEERYHIAAMEQTTDELLSLARNNRELRKVRQELKRILRTADLAKFAKASPLPEEHTGCMEAAHEIVKRTRIKEEVNNDQ